MCASDVVLVFVVRLSYINPSGPSNICLPLFPLSKHEKVAHLRRKFRWGKAEVEETGHAPPRGTERTIAPDVGAPRHSVRAHRVGGKVRFRATRRNQGDVDEQFDQNYDDSQEEERRRRTPATTMPRPRLHLQLAKRSRVKGPKRKAVAPGDAQPACGLHVRPLRHGEAAAVHHDYDCPPQRAEDPKS